ncbi:DgyrCDS9534 [Dimorphilus gyrociliatus]|uniref:DgyrCDS9534 n=1 Tax=Dimorphilus gyrociliatus TaxID=2664684 RepID=A0A7I8VX95_9ANNE|nr:DgyrCDS9534 [Dimorphilus gyrociliatus]
MEAGKKVKTRRVKRDVNGHSRGISALMLESYTNPDFSNRGPLISVCPKQFKPGKSGIPSQSVTIKDLKQFRAQVQEEADDVTEELEESARQVKEEIKKMKISTTKEDKSEEIFKKSKNLSNFIKQRKLYLKFLEEKQEVIGIVRKIHNEMIESCKHLRNKIDEYNDIWNEKESDYANSSDHELIENENPHKLFFLFDSVMLEVMKSHIPQWSPNGQHSKLRKYFAVRQNRDQWRNRDFLPYKYLNEIGRNFCDRIFKVVQSYAEYESFSCDSSDASSKDVEPFHGRACMPALAEAAYWSTEDDRSDMPTIKEVENESASDEKADVGDSTVIINLSELQRNGHEILPSDSNMELSDFCINLLRIGMIPLKTQMDTGARRSLIAKTALQKLPKTEVAKPECIPKTTNMIEIQTHGEVKYELQFGMGKKLCNFLVLDMHNNDLLLGIDFFRAVRATINIGLDIAEFFAEGCWHIIKAINGRNNNLDEIQRYIQQNRQTYSTLYSGLYQNEKTLCRDEARLYEEGDTFYGEEDIIYGEEDIFYEEECISYQEEYKSCEEEDKSYEEEGRLYKEDKSYEEEDESCEEEDKSYEEGRLYKEENKSYEEENESCEEENESCEEEDKSDEEGRLYKEEDKSYWGEDESCEEEDKFFEEGRLFKEEDKSYWEEDESSEEENKSYWEDDESSEEENKSYWEDESSEEEDKSYEEERRLYKEEDKSYWEEDESCEEKDKPYEEENKFYKEKNKSCEEASLYKEKDNHCQEKRASKRKSPLNNYKPAGGKMDESKQLWALRSLLAYEVALEEESEEEVRIKEENDREILRKFQLMRDGLN